MESRMKVEFDLPKSERLAFSHNPNEGEQEVKNISLGRQI